MQATATRRPSTRATRRIWAHLILNPAAGAGRAKRESAHLLRCFAERFGPASTHWVTHAPRAAAWAARRAVLGGVDLIVAAGGDGTLHEVVHGILAGTAESGRTCDLGIVDCGTGRGFAQSLGLPTTTTEQLTVIADGVARSVDLGQVRYLAPDGRTRERAFVNECQVGIGGAVVANLPPWLKRFGGRLGFGLATLIEILRRRPTPMYVTIDDRPPERLPLLGLVVANGSHCGGGMRIAPEARVDDGLLDVLLIHAMPVHERLHVLRGVYRGAHVEARGCTYLPCRRVAVEAEEPVPVAADGELLGHTPCRLEVLPSALNVRDQRR